MARGEAKVSEDKLQALIEGWNKKDIGELAQILGAKESTINFWAGKLRKSMKATACQTSKSRKYCRPKEECRPMSSTPS